MTRRSGYVSRCVCVCACVCVCVCVCVRVRVCVRAETRKGSGVRAGRLH